MTSGGRHHALGSELPDGAGGVYARYSSDHQSEASIDDQVRICRAEIERHGWNFVEIYTDSAMSGASIFRPGYQKLLQARQRAAFEIVVAEGLDRLSRDLADVATLYKHLSFLGRPPGDRGRGPDHRSACRAQGHDERAIRQGPRPEDAPGPGGTGEERHVWGWEQLRVRPGSRPAGGDRINPAKPRSCAGSSRSTPPAGAPGRSAAERGRRART